LTNNRPLFLLLYVLQPITYIKYIVIIIFLFVTAKSDQDPVLNPDPYWSGFLDPDQH
jgi:hypothetical protein